DAGGPSRTAAALVGAATVLVALVLVVLLGRARRHDLEIADAAQRAARLAALAQELSAALTEAEVATTATTLGRTPIQADATSIGVVEGDALRVHHGDTVPVSYRHVPGRLPL